MIVIRILNFSARGTAKIKKRRVLNPSFRPPKGTKPTADDLPAFNVHAQRPRPRQFTI